MDAVSASGGTAPNYHATRLEADHRGLASPDRGTSREAGKCRAHLN
jgi:hypothetical protein